MLTASISEPMKVPYWHYNVVSNQEGGASYASLRPPLRSQEDPELSIEAQAFKVCGNKPE